MELLSKEVIDTDGNLRYDLQELINIKEMKANILQQLLFDHQALTAQDQEEDVGEKVRLLLQNLLQDSPVDLQAQIAESIDFELLNDPEVNNAIFERLTDLGINVEYLYQTQPQTYQMFQVLFILNLKQQSADHDGFFSQ